MDEAGRSITVKIAGREYCLKVKDADEEEAYRLASQSVNNRIQMYQKKFLGKPETDILAFTAFSVCLANVRNARNLETAAKEVRSLHEELGNYLNNIEEK